MLGSKTIESALSLLKQNPSKTLGLTLGVHRNIQPGQYIPRADARTAPDLTFTVPDPNRTYMVVNLDLDAPFPAFSFLGPILHWLQPGLRPVPTTMTTSPTGGATYGFEVTAPFVANYIGPGPPPGSAPHRYVFFLYEQPAGFDVEKYASPEGQKVGRWPRVRYDWDKWVQEVQLGEVVAVNYFTSN
ncbi:YbhB/YbcL family Raf kinase inhibitor-like protein [Aspergillus brunneoviolaceus CBS 621.78]|uniref:PEBP-like protein n=1 Tax=Aspergillus brunneoviolaceus CBS 621.78 TaxID=1450534 RepID=A0ACD1GI82_9EURO|nr:PEBP-like protein [Aspergillus brunneoviolaceus CBS 621.78]RAH48814.1 PEBP-like protein [Aspergillus brunneoviolaceus CBS 621.78]